MFGRVPSTDCNHSSTGICPKCNLERTYNLNSPSKPLSIKNDRFIVTNHSESPKATPILDVFDLHSTSGSFNGHNTYLPDFKEDERSDQHRRYSQSSEVGAKSISTSRNQSTTTTEPEQAFMPSEGLDGTIEEQVEAAAKISEYQVRNGTNSTKHNGTSTEFEDGGRNGAGGTKNKNGTKNVSGIHNLRRGSGAQEGFGAGTSDFTKNDNGTKQESSSGNESRAKNQTGPKKSTGTEYSSSTKNSTRTQNATENSTSTNKINLLATTISDGHSNISSFTYSTATERKTSLNGTDGHLVATDPEEILISDVKAFKQLRINTDDAVFIQNSTIQQHTELVQKVRKDSMEKRDGQRKASVQSQREQNGQKAEERNESIEENEDGIQFGTKILRQSSTNGSESGVGTMESGTANVEGDEEDETYTSFEELQKQRGNGVDSGLEENSKNLPSSLIRLFESTYFNMEIALQYLYKNDNIDVVMYLGRILHRFPPAEVDFFIPQLIAMYINMNHVASAIHNYMIERCRSSMEFSLECFWLLDAYGVEQFKTHHKKAQGFFLRETILNEYMKSHQIQKNLKTPAASAALHHRSQSDARLSEEPSPVLIEEPQFFDQTEDGCHMRRTESTRSVRSMYQGSAMADLSSGRAFDNKCRCIFNSSASISNITCSCGADQKTRPELAFVDSLIAIGNRLKDIPIKEDKSKRLVYELFLLNLNLPAKVWLPIYDTQHVMVRIPYAEGCVLNSKDKAPYCIYCEVVEVDNFETARLPEKKVELEGEFHKTMRSNSSSSMYNIGSPNNAHLANTFALPTLSPVEEAACARAEKPVDALNIQSPVVQMVAPTITEPEPSRDDDVLTQFDRIIDETLSVADSDDLSSQWSADAEFREEPQSKFEKIRNRLAALKRRRRQRIAHSPDDPSASAMSEPWEEKQARIRQSSPYGELEGWKLVPVIIKTGDDLRQELLAYQLLTTLQNIWRDENVPLYLRPYKILVCSSDSGMIEPIPNACSLHQIKKNLSSKPSLDDAAQPYSPTLLSHFLINYGSRLSESFQQAQQNFVKSCAAYSLACYFLQVKDRHNGNILLDSEGHLIHIDFGYILSISPKNLGFETSPFKLTQELIDVMGGPNSDMFAVYKQLIFNGMVAARKHSERIINIVEVMSSGSQLPCFRGGPNVLRLLRERFHLGYTEQQLRQMVNQLVEQSRDSLTTRLYDNFQYYTNGIF